MSLVDLFWEEADEKFNTATSTGGATYTSTYYKRMIIIRL